MHVIVASDIFGRTAALENLCARIAADCDIVDPYGGRPVDFESEAHAYAHFTQECGLATYAAKIANLLGAQSRQVSLIGFSVGASAIWKLSEGLSAANVARAACFYGSQIRHHLDVRPSVLVELFLPSSEASFDIDVIAQALASRQNVVLHKTRYPHGFMNRLSKNFSHEGLSLYIDGLRSWGSTPGASGDVV